MKLKVRLMPDSGKPGQSIYNNEINSENFKEIALILLDLSNYGLPVEKAIKEYLNLKKSDWEASIGL